MNWTFIALLLFFVSASCGKKVDGNGSEESVSKAEALINDRKFEQAIALLEPLSERYPDNFKIQEKLLHAYAGAGTFEALKVIDIWKKMEKELKKKNTTKVNQRDLGLSARSFQSRAERILAPLPKLTNKQSQRLDQAINLYQKLGLEVDSAGKYRNFKWGTLHIYRLAINSKIILADVSKASEQKPLDKKKIEEAVFSKISIIGQDIFMVYRLFGNSYDNIKKLTDGVDKMISKAVDDKKFKLQVNETVLDQAEFFHSVLADNIGAASILVKKLSDIFSGNSFSSKWTDFLDVLPGNEQITESEQNIISLIKIFLKTFAEKHPEFEEKIKGLFNAEFKTLLTKAANDSIRLKNMDPLQEFFDSKRIEVQVIVSYYKVLRNEIKMSDLSDDIQQQIEPLTKKLKHDSLEASWIKVTEDIKKEEARIKESASSEGTTKLLELNKKRDEIKSQLDALKRYLGALGPISDAAMEAPVDDEPNSEQADQEPSEGVEDEVESTDETNDLVE